jgi:hypothetical protein
MRGFLEQAIIFNHGKELWTAGGSGPRIGEVHVQRSALVVGLPQILYKLIGAGDGDNVRVVGPWNSVIESVMMAF